MPERILDFGDICIKRRHRYLPSNPMENLSHFKMPERMLYFGKYFYKKGYKYLPPKPMKVIMHYVE